MVLIYQEELDVKMSKELGRKTTTFEEKGE